MDTQVSETTKFVVVAHGDVELSHGFPDFYEEKNKRCPLTERGITQVKKLAAHYVIKGLNVDIILTSSMKRARQTSVILGDHLGIKKSDILITDSLVELNENEQLSLVSARQALSLAEKRISSWFNTIVANPLYKGKTILLVTHQYAIGSMIKCASNTDLNRRVEVNPASYTQFSYSEGVLDANLINVTIT
jgi:broad specificity phosphatase PhoE